MAAVPAAVAAEAASTAAAAAATAATAAAAAAVAANEEEISPEVYLGVVKSYNDRRGFGFVACVETAAKYGRDVYMPKAEATLAAAEYSGFDINPEGATAAAAAAAAAEKAAAAALAALQSEKSTANSGENQSAKPPPAPRLAEEDLVIFRVRLSVEGYPQAAKVKKMRKFVGTVLRAPEYGASIGGTQLAPGAIESDELLAAHGFREVPVYQADCGQIRLAPGDEVAFCVPEVAGDAGGAASKAQAPLPATSAPPAAKAMMISLSRTGRGAGSVLGCFALDLPRTGCGEGAPPRDNLILDCHAFGDKLVLAGLPADLGEAELMRFFSKQGASGAIVAHAKSRSFASVSFPSTTEVARFLGRTSHAFADEKETRITKLLPLNPAADTARLPALPAPSLTVGEEPGSLLVVWSPLVLAVGYSVELRPAGTDGKWAAVEVGSSTLGEEGTTDEATKRFNSDSSSCRVVSLTIGAMYEARVSYFTDCGTRSEPSEASEWSMTQATASAPQVVHPPPPLMGPLASQPPPAPAPAQRLHLDDAFRQDPYAAYAMPPYAPPAPGWPMDPAGMHVPAATGYPMPAHYDPYAMVNPTQPQPDASGFGQFLPSVPSVSWRSATGMVVPPPARPALKPADDYGFAVSVQWPAVAQAAAYVVELREAGSQAFERFVRSAPEAKLGTLVELRVGGLRPGPPPGRVYVAQVRTCAADGSESAPSPAGWSPPLPSQPLSGGASAPAPVLGTSGTVAGGTATPLSMGGTQLSADAATFTPSAAGGGGGLLAYEASVGTAAAGTMSTVPAGVPLPATAGVPPVPPPPGAAADYGAWAPPPWLGQQPMAPHALGATPAAPSNAPPAPPGQAADPSQAAALAYGAPGAGGPPPPPTAPPVSPFKLQADPQAPSANEECLILD